MNPTAKATIRRQARIRQNARDRAICSGCRCTPMLDLEELDAGYSTAPSTPQHAQPNP